MGGTRVQEDATLIVTNPGGDRGRHRTLYVGPAGSLFSPVVPPASSTAVVPVPEPGTLALLAAGVAAMAAALRRKKRNGD